jgi:heat-inducible transcriptional repressor
MLKAALQDKRNQRILADVVRAYIETGEPVSSRAIARRLPENLSPATVRNVMADLEEEGYLYQPHTSAGRVPTPSAYRFFAQQALAGSQLTPEDQAWVRQELSAARTPEEIMARASHVLATLSRGLGIIVSPPLGQVALEFIRFVLLPDDRLLIVLVSGGGNTRDKVLRLGRTFTQAELDQVAQFLNAQYRGRTLDAIRADLQKHIARDRERYDRMLGNALLLCDPALLGGQSSAQVFVEGAAQIAAAPEFGQQELQELLAAIEERQRLVILLTDCIESPEAVHVQIGIREIGEAGEHLALISAPYVYDEHSQGTLGVLGPMRMQYERAITAVAFVAKLFNESLGER